MSVNFALLIRSCKFQYDHFQEVWQKYGNGFRKSEPREIIDARNKLFEELNKLFRILWEIELRFKKGDADAIEEIVKFVEVEQTTFRIGYARQRFFRKLKSVTLSNSQKERIQNVGLKYCSSNDYKREYRDLVRLLIKIVDKEFISKVVKIKDKSDGVVKFKANLMLETILHNRKDLQNE